MDQLFSKRLNGPAVCRGLLLVAVMVGPGSDFLIADEPSQTPSGQRRSIIDDSTAQPATSQNLASSSDDKSDSEGNTAATSEESSDPDTGSNRLSDLHRPLFSISLATAASPEAIDAETLREPRNRAGELYAARPVIYDVSGFVRVPRPQRDLFRVCYWPLYFEEPNMERCGRGHGLLTECVSAVDFFGQIPLLPYLMAVAPPRCCVPALPDCPACHAFGHDACVRSCGR